MKCQNLFSGESKTKKHTKKKKKKKKHHQWSPAELAQRVVKVKASLLTTIIKILNKFA